MLQIDFEYNINLADIDEKMKVALVGKMTELTALMYSKVMENLSGKVLQSRTGKLKESVRQQVREQGETTIVGSVFIDPVTPKALALELGGKGTYPISPKSAKVLMWEEGGTKIFRAYVAAHPASKAFGYLREAFEEMEAIVPEALRGVIADVWGEA